MTEPVKKRKRGRPKGSKTKKRTGDLAVDTVAPAPVYDEAAVVPDTRPAGVNGEWVTVTLRVPVGPAPPGYHSPRVDISRLTHAQTEIMARVFSALNQSHAQLASGRHVDKGVDVVRWLLDEIDRQV